MKLTWQLHADQSHYMILEQETEEIMLVVWVQVTQGWNFTHGDSIK